MELPSTRMAVSANGFHQWAGDVNMYICGTSKFPCKKSWWDTFVVNEGVGIMISFVGRIVSFAEYG